AIPQEAADRLRRWLQVTLRRMLLRSQRVYVGEECCQQEDAGKTPRTARWTERGPTHGDRTGGLHGTLLAGVVVLRRAMSQGTVPTNSNRGSGQLFSGRAQKFHVAQWWARAPTSDHLDDS